MPGLQIIELSGEDDRIRIAVRVEQRDWSNPLRQCVF